MITEQRFTEIYIARKLNDFDGFPCNSCEGCTHLRHYPAEEFAPEYYDCMKDWDCKHTDEVGREAYEEYCDRRRNAQVQ